MRTLTVAGTTSVAAARRDLLLRSGLQVTLDPDPDDTGPTVLLLDPGDRGATETIAELARRKPVIVVPGEARPAPELVWSLMVAGAYDVIVWDEETTSAAIAARIERWRAVYALCDSHAVGAVAVGTSPAWRRVLHELVEIAAFTSASVLVTGETGTHHDQP